MNCLYGQVGDLPQVPKEGGQKGKRRRYIRDKVFKYLWEKYLSIYTNSRLTKRTKALANNLTETKIKQEKKQNSSKNQNAPTSLLTLNIFTVTLIKILSGEG